MRVGEGHSRGGFARHTRVPRLSTCSMHPLIAGLRCGAAPAIKSGSFYRPLWPLQSRNPPKYSARLYATRRPTPSFRAISNVAPTAIVPATSWVEKMPAATRPYLYLTRIDKPIGSLLLFYPCGMCTSLRTLFGTDQVIFSLVYHNGILSCTCARIRAVDIPCTVRYWCTANARSRVHHKRYVGS